MLSNLEMILESIEHNILKIISLQYALRHHKSHPEVKGIKIMN